MNTYAHPFIGNKPVGEITTDNVLQILKPIWNTKTETASRVRSRIELILSYAKALNLRNGENPATWRSNLDALLPAPSKLKNVRHHPALPYVHMPEFMKALRTIMGSGARALEFAILTASRSREARLATWSEIDLNNRLWTIPAERMKGKRDHWVPLSAQTIKLIESLPKIEGNNFLFIGTKENTAISDMTMTAIIRRFNRCEDGEKPRWIDPATGSQIVPHGFRSTFRDWAAELGEYPRELAEHALAHNLPNKVEAAYHRGTMQERRRPMMQAWADYVEKTDRHQINL